MPRFDLGKRGVKSSAAAVDRSIKGSTWPPTGFEIAGEWFAWGATMADVAQRGIKWAKVDGDPNFRYVHCVGRVLALDHSLIELQQHADERPICAVSYQISRSPGSSHIECIQEGHAKLLLALNEPTSGQGDVSQLQRGHLGEVILYARWQAPSASWGVSWFGDVRHAQGHAVSGAVYTVWDDPLEAAKPYLGPYQARQTALEGVRVTEVLARLLNTDRRLVEAEDHALTQARRVLARSDVLFTTPPLASALGFDAAGELVVWRAEDGRLGVSTPRDTVLIEPHGLLPLQWLHLHPAKGAGGHHVSVASLAMDFDHRPVAQCASIQRFVDALRARPQVTYQFIEEHDA